MGLVETRKCRKCGEIKPISKFGKFRNGDKVSIRRTCSKCKRWKPPKGYMNKYNKTEAHKKAFKKYKNSERGKRKTREHILKRHNMTLEEYDKLIEQQNHVCFLCGEPEIGKRLAVDHNHKTGKVRGLLCQQCNCCIGFIENRGLSIKDIQKYLEK